jgi:N-acetylglucosamine-6-phosphate deacetylase
MILANAKLCDHNFCLIDADLQIKGEFITQVTAKLKSSDERIDLTGCIILPGLIDLHIHGCAGADTCDATTDSLRIMSEYLASYGVTSYCPTTMTIPLPALRDVLANVHEYMNMDPVGARVIGVHMEGPFISEQKSCAHSSEHIQIPDYEVFSSLTDDYPGLVKIVDVAPEMPGAMDFISRARENCTVSLSHSATDYDTAMLAFTQGITHVTHLFNAMSGIHHRNPGAACAVFDDDKVMAEMICDGLHLHPAVMRLACKLLGEDRTILVSDSIRAAGLPDGTYELGDKLIQVRDGRTSFEGGQLAGSTTNVYQECKNLLRIGVPWKQVIKSATINPARQIGVDAEIGSIEVGKYADLLIVDQCLEIQKVFIHGKEIVSRCPS